MTKPRAEQDEHPPTTQESYDFIRAKQDAFLGAVPEGIPERPRAGLLWWLLVFATFAFLSGAVFQTTRAQGQTPETVCVEKLAALVNPTIMSRATAMRKARGLCQGLRHDAPDFYRAITR